jgi:hypothetical protein
VVRVMIFELYEMQTTGLRTVIQKNSIVSPAKPQQLDGQERRSGNAEVHVLDAGHFALDTGADEIAALITDFAASSVGDLRARRAG